MDIDSYITAIKEIKEILPEAARYEQLAEECCELAQAALKRARKMRDENYTPKTIEEIDENISEEISDVILCIDSLDLNLDYDICEYKLNRWINRNKKDSNENN